MRKLALLLVAAMVLMVLSVPVMAQDEGEEMMSDVSYVRISHLSPDAASVIVFIDGEIIISGLPFERVTRWLDLAPGTYEIALGSTSGDIANAFFGPVEYTFEPNSFTTLAAVGADDPGTADINEFQLIQIDESEAYASYQAAGNAILTIFHGADGVGPVDIYAAPSAAEPAEGEEAVVVDPVADGIQLIDALAFPGSFLTPAGPPNDGTVTMTVPAGTYDIAVVPNGLAEPVVLSLTEAELEDGINYFVAAGGSADAPALVVEATDSSDFAFGSILDIAMGNEDFSILVDAVSASPRALSALSGNGPFTVFAPTNAAFEAALADLGITAEDLLGNEDLLTSVLLYHVVGAAGGGAISSVELAGRDSVLTLSNEFLTADDALLGSVVIADIRASNGVIHAIDTVLLPPADEEAEASEE